MKDYKEILEGIVNIINTAEKSDIGFTNICAYIGENCSEFKESEDEKIRKALIDYFDDMKKADVRANSFHPDTILAWLEKQGEKDKLIKELSEYKVKYTQEVLEKHINNITDKDDEKIRNALIGSMKAGKAEGRVTFATIPLDDCIAWLEKQGKLNPVIVPEFRIGDIITPKGKKEYYTIIDIVNGWYEFKEKHINGGIPICYQYGWELVKQKSAEWSKEDENTLKACEKIPQKIQIGGQELTTQMCDELGGNLGRCCISNGYIKIATNVDGSAQTESSMFNTYIHECVHAILDTMGRDDLSRDEKFVSTFAGFATEGIVSILKQNNLRP